MPLTAGTRLGAYEIFSLLGAGGMGEVYRALDRRLGREVAIKVLPPAFSQNADRLARFEREARLLAALNHPNIAAIHGLEAADGVRFLVLELVPGKTLSERLGRSPLPIREALDIGRQIAQGLASAHEKGVIHRDLKPSNVQVTLDGKVKVLDFGLAKGAIQGVGEAGRSEVPTGTGAGTHDGVILGTAPYMSPEQARGQELDKQTDIWSFGCVLYEMLTATRAFGGRTVSDTIAATLEREPDWEKLAPTTPAAVASLLRRCLRKDRLRRLHDIGDAQIEIEEALAVLASSPSAAAAQTAARSRRRAWQVAALLGSILVSLGASAWLAGLVKPAPAVAPSSLTRLNIQLPDRVTLPFANNATLAVSPDARNVVFRGHIGLRTQLYLRRMDQITATPIAGTEDGEGPFFSPDGEWLGFWTDGKLKKIPLEGGEAKTICDLQKIRGASWGPDDTILLGGSGRGLSLVSAAGGTPRVLTTPDPAQGVDHRWPQFLPGGRAALFSTASASGREGERAVALVALETGKWRVLLVGGTFPRYVATGHLLYGLQGSVFAAPFDLKRLEVKGPAQRVLEDVAMESSSTGAVSLDVAPGGVLVYMADRSRPPDRLLQWLDRQGKTTLVTGVRQPYTAARISPEGRRVAVIVIRGHNDQELSVYDLARETWTPLASSALTPVWSPDGKRVAFSSNKNGPWNLFWAPADGQGRDRAAHPTGGLVPSELVRPGWECARVRTKPEPREGWKHRVASAGG